MALLLLCPIRAIPCLTSVVSYKNSYLWHFCCCVLQEQFLVSLRLCLTRIVPCGTCGTSVLVVLQEQFLVSLLLCLTRIVPCGTSVLVSYKSLWHFCSCVLQEQFLVSLLLCLTRIVPCGTCGISCCCVLQEQFLASLLFCLTRIVPCGTSVLVSYKSNSMSDFCCVLQE